MWVCVGGESEKIDELRWMKIGVQFPLWVLWAGRDGMWYGRCNEL